MQTLIYFNRLLDHTFCVYAKTYGQIGIKLCTYTSSQNSLSQWGCIIHCILSVRCMRSISRTLTLFDVCKVLYFPLLKAYLQHNKTPWHQTLSWSQKILCILDQLRLFCVRVQHESSFKILLRISESYYNVDVYFTVWTELLIWEKDE